MPIEVFDFRTDIRNLFISPTMRGRFLRHEPGESGPFHNHDIADELFLILQGQCEFTIEGERAILSPGQVCFARSGEKHEIRVIGDEPMIMFLVVAPHLEPTHTFWNPDGSRQPEHYNMTTAVEYAAEDQSEPTELLAKIVSVCLTQLVTDVTEANRQLVGQLSDLSNAGPGAKSAIDHCWRSIRTMHEHLFIFQAAWNSLAQRIAEEAKATPPA